MLRGILVYFNTKIPHSKEIWNHGIDYEIKNLEEELVQLHTSLQEYLANSKQFVYKTKCSGRRLKDLFLAHFFSITISVLKAVFPKGKKELAVSLFQVKYFKIKRLLLFPYAIFCPFSCNFFEINILWLPFVWILK